MKRNRSGGVEFLTEMGKQEYKKSERGACSRVRRTRAAHEETYVCEVWRRRFDLTRLPLSPHPAVRFGELSKEQRKAVNKVVNKSLQESFDDTHICTGEISAMLDCFDANEYDTLPCKEKIDEMYTCVEEHQYDPDPKVLARKWQAQMQGQVFRHFAQMKILSRLRR